MSLRVLTFFSLLVLVSSQAFAENSFLIEHYNGLTKDRFCSGIDEKELETFKTIKCYYPSSLAVSRISSYDIFEWSVFQKSAELQLKKNECLRQKISAIVNDDKLLEQWTTQLKQSWLGMKKAELTLEKCEKMNQKPHSLPQALHSPQFLSKKGLDPEWVKLCEDKELLNQLAVAKDLFVFSMPVVSDSEFFDLMYDQRDELLNKKTGKPFTFQEILDADVKDLSNAELSKKSKEILHYKIKNKFRELSYERKTISDNLVSNRNKITKTYKVDSDTRDFLFEDNTVYETLSDLKLLGIPDSQSRQPQVPMGVKCLLNRYESNETAEIAEFLVLSAGWGVAFKILALTKISRLAAFKKNKFWTSLFAAGENQAIPKTIQECSSDLYQKTKLSNRNGKVVTEFDPKPFKEEFAFKFHELEIPAKSTPSCKGLEKHVVVNDFKRSGCLINALQKQMFVF